MKAIPTEMGQTLGWGGGGGAAREQPGAQGGLGLQADLASRPALPVASCVVCLAVSALDSLFVKGNYEYLPPKVILKPSELTLINCLAHGPRAGRPPNGVPSPCDSTCACSPSITLS